MNRFAAIVSALMLTFTLAAFSSNYDMHPNDGRTIVTDGKYKVDNDTGLIRYIDANGIQQQINRPKVNEMTEHK